MIDILLKQGTVDQVCFTISSVYGLFTSSNHLRPVSNPLRTDSAVWLRSIGPMAISAQRNSPIKDDPQLGSVRLLTAFYVSALRYLWSSLR